MKTIKNLMNDEAGATAIEYGLIAALIAIAAIGVMGELGTNLKDQFQKAADALKLKA